MRIPLALTVIGLSALSIAPAFAQESTNAAPHRAYPSAEFMALYKENMRAIAKAAAEQQVQLELIAQALAEQKAQLEALRNEMARIAAAEPSTLPYTRYSTDTANLQRDVRHLKREAEQARNEAFQAQVRAQREAQHAAQQAEWEARRAKQQADTAAFMSRKSGY